MNNLCPDAVVIYLGDCPTIGRTDGEHLTQQTQRFLHAF